MLTAKKRGSTYRLEGRLGGQRVRFTLATRDYGAAVRCATQLERALVEGKDSELWSQLAPLLPARTFQFFADMAGWNDVQAARPTWAGVRANFAAMFEQLVRRGKRSANTWTRYQITLDAFQTFLTERGLVCLDEITRRELENFKGWRLAKIMARKQARHGGGLDLDLAVLHKIFAFAVETELAIRNPVKTDGTPGANPARGAQPFTAEELEKLRGAAGRDMLAFLLLRHAGLRGFDTVDLRWGEVNFESQQIWRTTQKRKKVVVIALHPELAFALEAEHQRRQPAADAHVLLNPDTQTAMTRPRLYERMRRLGTRAGLLNVHPHRFRDTLAVDLLLKGASPYDVAKLLGDTVAVVETHYSPYVRELQERGRRFIEADGGLEKLGTNWAHRPADKERLQ